MKKSLKVLLGMVTTIALFTGCSSKDTEIQSDNQDVIEQGKETLTEEDTIAMYDGEELVIGIMPSLDNITLLYAEEENLYEKHGANVRVERFYNPKDRDIALIGEQLNSVVCDILAVATYEKSEIPTKMVSGMKSNFGLVINGDDEATSIEDLEGKKVVYSKNSVIEYTIDKMLESANMSEDSIEKIEVPAIPLRVEMLAKGEVDAAVLPMPYYNQAVLDGSTYITDSTALGIDVVGIATTDEYLLNNEENVLRFLAAYNEATDIINEMDKDEFEVYAIESLGWSEELKGNLGEYTLEKSYLPEESQINTALEWALKKGLSEKLLTYDDVIYLENK